jgi:hypothetical protein
MIFAKTLPDDLTKHLYSFSDWFFKQDLSQGVQLAPKKLDTQYAASQEYLDLMRARPDNVGYPEEAYGADFKHVGAYNTNVFHDRVRELDAALMAFTGSRNSALKMYYPPGGYIGWHNNANAPGYNILFTYSETGEGDFRYIHPQTGELVIMPDIKGWSCKVGYYDIVDGNPLWHAAWTNCNRLNWGYIIHPLLWADLANELGIDPNAISDIFGRDPANDESAIKIFNRGPQMMD